MISLNTTVVVNNGVCVPDKDIYIFKGDANIMLVFKLVNPQYKLTKSEEDNLINYYTAEKFSFRLKCGDYERMVDAQPTNEGIISIMLTEQAIGQMPIGNYEYQFSLLDEESNGIISFNPIKANFHIADRIFQDGDELGTPSAIGYARAGISTLAFSNRPEGDEEDVFDSEGYYNRKIWVNGELITSKAMNNIESAIFTNSANIANKFDEVTCEKVTDENGLQVNKLAFYANGKELTYVYIQGGGGGGSSEVTMSTTTPTETYGIVGNNIILDISYNTTCPNKTGRLVVTVNGQQVKTDKVNPGVIPVDVTQYLARGTNEIEVAINDQYGASDFIVFSINMVELGLTSNFNSAQVFTDSFLFNFTASGSITKTVHVAIDGKDVYTETVNTSGQFKTCTVPKQAHGDHKLTCYITCDINGQTVSSEALEYTIVCLDESASTPVIGINYNETQIEQYSILTIPYIVATPGVLNSDIELYLNGDKVGQLTVDRTQHLWTVTDYPAGRITLEIRCGSVKEQIIIAVKEVVLNISEKTDKLDLYLSSKNRVNDDNKANWTYNGINATFTNFNWETDGWQLDDDNLPVLRVQGDARVNIPIQPFNTDFKGTGKALEFEFKITDVTDYDDIVISCMSGDKGIEIGCKEAILKTNELTVGTEYKDNERIRVAFSIESTAQNRIIGVYLNGILSGLARYDVSDIFVQSSPVSISIGNNNCALDLYNIRVYSASLSLSEALNNYIYDMNNPATKMELYSKNNLYDDYGAIDYRKVLNFIPCMTIVGELPPVKGDKKEVKIVYENKQDSDRDFTQRNVTLDIQGTSSQYYPKKNYKFKLPVSYQLRKDSIAEKVFCIKADYMESSHSHNTGMAKIVHNMYYEYVPGQSATNGVRTTIDGFPIVVFHQEEDEGARQFLGIYNFNNDKDDVTTFGYQGDTECWEVCNNTSPRTLFRQSEYEELDDNGKPAWQTDFEARYPDKNVDYTNLKRLTDWIVSTDGDIDKFKAEFELYFNKHYVLVYAVLTELFAMVDSRAKNMFLASWDKEHWYPVFYDMDTCFGLNNEGVLAFDYNVETNDVIGTQNVFNGKNSLLWNNVEQAFSEEIKAMYNKLRDDDKLTYEKVLSVLEGEQIARLCEVLYNEDAQYKYLGPLLNDKIATYLYIAQGSRINHLKYWLWNRFNYMDSKYFNSDFKDNYATFRLYTPTDWQGVEPNPNFTITSCADQYTTVNYGGYILNTRANADVPVTINAPNITFNDTETIIYGASRISSLGDLSNKYAGTIDLSKATALTEIIVGSNEQGYVNTNLHNLSVGNNTLVRKLNACNCPNLEGTIDLSGCVALEEVYLTGTNVTTVKLGEGANLETLHLPASIVNLTLINKVKLESIVTEGYNNVNTLILENCKINPFSLLEQCPNVEYVRFLDVDCNASVQQLQMLANYKGVNSEGVQIPISQALTGKVTIAKASEIIVADLQALYPNIEINVIEYMKSYIVRFFNGDNEVIYTQNVLENGEAVYVGDTPTKTSTAQYDFTFTGWDRQLKPVISNTDIYAQFDNVLRYYTIRFINGDTLEVLKEEVLGYGSMPTPPELPSAFNAWKPSLVDIVTGHKDYYTQYIPYPDDLSIFTFVEYKLNGQKVYQCNLNTSYSLPSFIIIPFKYNDCPVVAYRQSTSYTTAVSNNLANVTQVYVPDSIKFLGPAAFAYMNVQGLDLPNVEMFYYNVSTDFNNTAPNTDHQFYYCKAQYINLPKLTEIPRIYNSSSSYIGAFAGASARIIHVGSKEYPFTKVNNQGMYSSSYCHLNGCSANLICTTENGLMSDVEVVSVGYNVGSEKFRATTDSVISVDLDDLYHYFITDKNEAWIVGNIVTPQGDVVFNSTFNGKKITRMYNRFQNNADVTSVVLPEYVELISQQFFAYCTSLTSVSNVEHLKELDSATFSNCNRLQSELRLFSVTRLGDFYNGMSSYYSPFYECGNLTKIFLGSKETPFKRWDEPGYNNHKHFDDCYRNVAFVNFVTENGSVDDITGETIWLYTNYPDKVLFTTVPAIDVIEGDWVGIQVEDTGMRITEWRGEGKEVTVPSTLNGKSVIELGKNCLYNKGLEEVTIPSSVKRILDYALAGNLLSEIRIPDVEYLGSYALASNKNLVYVQLGKCKYIGTYCFNNSSAGVTTFLGTEAIEEIDNYGLQYFNLSQVSLSNLKKIGTYGLSGWSSLTELTLPALEEIAGNYTFSNCSNLTTIDLPKLIKINGGGTFDSCPKLTTIRGMQKLTTLASSAFYSSNHINNNKIVTIGPINGVIYLPELMNVGTNSLAYLYNATEIRLPKLPTLTSQLFNTCYKTTRIELPSVTNITGSSPFYNCNALTTITGMQQVTEIYARTFCYDEDGDSSYNCKKLVTIGDIEGEVNLPNVKTVNGGAFAYTAITKVNLPECTTFGYNGFYYCRSLQEVNAPKLEVINNYCFYMCSVLNTLSLSEVYSIGTSAFYGVSGMQVVLPSIITIGNGAFNSITSITLGGQGKPITSTGNFNASAFNGTVQELIIFVSDADNPPTLTGSPWSATNATITYEQA